MANSNNRKIAQPERIAVLIPCYNEEGTIGDVVRQFRSELPHAGIFVFDNNSTDHSAAVAESAGARVHAEPRQGKGYVVQSMFSSVEADIYVIVDGDGTYPPSAVQNLIAPILSREADMVVGSRLHRESYSQFNTLNRFGNDVFLRTLNGLFGSQLSDILSGYRAFSRRLVKEIPLFSTGFEVESELTVKVLEYGYKVKEIPIGLVHRPKGSESKIRIIPDGLRILGMILMLFRDHKPLAFFGSLGLFFIVAGFVPGVVVVIEFLLSGLVLRLPSAILAVGLVLSGMLLVLAGLILHTMVSHFRELTHRLKVLHRRIDSLTGKFAGVDPNGEDRDYE